MAGRFVTRPSKRLIVLLSLAHLIAMGAIWATDLVIWGRLGFVSLILLSQFHLLDRYFSPGKQSWHTFSLDKLRIAVVTRSGLELAGNISDQTVVTPYFVLLRVKFDGHRFPASQIIFPDVLQEGAYRELCVRLKFG